MRFHYTLVAVRGLWVSGEGVAGDDADEVAWLSRAEIVAGGLPTAPALLPLIDLALTPGKISSVSSRSLHPGPAGRPLLPVTRGPVGGWRRPST